eukprot:gb/GECG01006422.1/.p1 GENE.gb/GECG01006422.1/~~gb/GECG01006422.1/.p1  ORF type:complete len:791 (+),score=105.71 gb/GECG01006422.1/:1-2373(+)
MSSYSGGNSRVPPPGRGTQQGGGSKGQGGYFDTRRGEVNELRGLLQKVNKEKDGKRKRDVIKKVIAFMTLGIDVSRLFSEMVMASNTKDLVIKKMVYLYLSNYARSNPDLTLLTINTLQKDCRDDDPMVRGLALRSLCSLRLNSILEYVMTPLRQSLSDRSPYVRKTAVTGVLKVYHLNPSMIKESDFVDTLYNMIRDREPLVVTNCIHALNEILAEEGGIVINQAIVHHLLNRIKDFSDWGMCTVLQVVAKYKPETKKETFGIMNLIDPCLRVSNSAVVLDTTKCFLELTREMSEIQNQVFERLRTPLLTLMASATKELAYVVLKHVALIVDNAPGIFNGDYKAFFCRYGDPTSVNEIKMDVLPKVADKKNFTPIINELSEYVSGVDPGLSRHAVRSIGEVAMNVPEAVNDVVSSLLEILDMEMEEVLGETVVVIRNLLRKFPSKASDVIPSVHRTLNQMEDIHGRAAIIWMIGEYGQQIDEAPYLLEPLIDSVDTEESVDVRLQLLSATAKLFFKRPPEVQKMFGRLLEAALSDAETPLVRDRALLYYRLLRKDVDMANEIINTPEPPVERYFEDAGDELRDVLIGEFNSLSVIYNKPGEQFIPESHWVVNREADQQETREAATAAEMDDDLLGGGTDSAAASEDANGGTSDLLGGTGSEKGGTDSSPAGVELDPQAAMDPKSYQSKWSAMGVASKRSFTVSKTSTTEEIERLVGGSNIKVVASGDTGGTLKFYLYAKDKAFNSLHLIELLVHKSSREVKLQVKSDRNDQTESVISIVKNSLSGLGIQ